MGKLCIYNCVNCNTYCEKYNTRKKFCSIKCQQDFSRKTKVFNNTASSHTLKIYLTETKGYSCELCGLSGYWNGKKLTLQLDHIDGNSDNNTLENVRLVCPNCHTQTHTWCGRQKKTNKRNIYLQKYKGDKSKSETPLLHSGEEGAVPSLPTNECK
jgi:hypothetical protein